MTEKAFRYSKYIRWYDEAMALSCQLQFEEMSDEIWGKVTNKKRRRKEAVRQLTKLLELIPTA